MYRLTESENIIVRIEDGANIPTVGTNRHYAEYLEWVAAGNQPEPYIEPVYVPSMVSMRQARLALLQAGLLATVNDALATIQGVEGDAARIEWEYSTIVDRESVLVNTMASALSIPTEVMDSLFLTASQL